MFIIEQFVCVVVVVVLYLGLESEQLASARECHYSRVCVCVCIFVSHDASWLNLPLARASWLKFVYEFVHHINATP